MMEGVLEQNRLFELGAKMLMKTTKALEAECFSREEAIRIVAAQGCMIKANNG